MSEEKKCKECKWLIGKKASHGVECMQPDKQAEWNRRKALWMGELRTPHARWKQPSALACRRFEPK